MAKKKEVLSSRGGVAKNVGFNGSRDDAYGLPPWTVSSLMC